MTQRERAILEASEHILRTHPTKPSSCDLQIEPHPSASIAQATTGGLVPGRARNLRDASSRDSTLKGGPALFRMSLT